MNGVFAVQPSLAAKRKLLDDICALDWIQASTEWPPQLVGADDAGFLIYEPGTIVTFTIHAKAKAS